MKTYGDWLCDVEHNGYNLRYVPEDFLTSEICLVAVKQWGPALGFIPEELKTLEMCVIALKDNIFTIDHVPKKFHSLFIVEHLLDRY